MYPRMNFIVCFAATITWSSVPASAGQLESTTWGGRPFIRREPEVSVHEPEGKAKTELLRGPSMKQQGEDINGHYMRQQTAQHDANSKAVVATIDEAGSTGSIVDASASSWKTITQSESAIQEAAEHVASDFASLGLKESEIDPDANYHAHKNVSFQVRVTDPTGAEMCLSEVHHGYAVQAVRCSGTHGQHWYWSGKRLKTLKSDERCLGYANLGDMSDVDGHQLAMYPCSAHDDSMYTAWVMDHSGRLRSLQTDHCMAFDEQGGHINAITLPCEG